MYILKQKIIILFNKNKFCSSFNIGLNYHGEQKSHRVLCYCGEGNIQVISLKANMHNNAQNKNINQGSYGKFYEKENLYHLKNEIHMMNLRNYNLGLSKYLQIHQNNNFFSFANLKIKVLNNTSMNAPTTSKLHFAIHLKILTFFDKLYPTLEYPV